MRVSELWSVARPSARFRRPSAIPDGSGTPHNKLCAVEDFRDPAIRGFIREVFPHEIARFGAEYPSGVEYRKHWEVAMSARAFSEGGVLHDHAQILGVGAGNEPTIFWLTNRVARVFATDLYLDSGAWSVSANGTMLVDPSPHWPGPWNPRRLVVQHMNALDLRYEDETFDGLFSSSSIEHFGTPADVSRAADEMCRVLKPGGLLSLSTEFRLAGPPPGLPGTLLFDADQVRDLLIGDRHWTPVGPIDWSLSESSIRAAIPQADASADVRRHLAANDGNIHFHRLDWGRYPHVVLRRGEHLWTSFHIALRKEG